MYRYWNIYNIYKKYQQYNTGAQDKSQGRKEAEEIYN